MTLGGNCEAPPSYSFTPYYLSSIRSAPKSKIKQFYLAYTLAKLALDILCIAGFDMSLGGGITTAWAPLQILIDLVLLASALSCDVLTLKFVEVFAYIYFVYYAVIIAFLPWLMILFYNQIEPIVEIINRYKDDLPPGMAIAVNDGWKLFRRNLDRMWICYEISFLVSAGSVLIRAYLAEKLIEFRIIEKHHIKELTEMTTHV